MNLLTPEDREYPDFVCLPCGYAANPEAEEVVPSTQGFCDVCGVSQAVTTPAAFGYPTFKEDAA